jgi:ankyrin repeat protein
LILEGADVFKPNKYGNTPMIQAATVGNLDAMKYLYEKAKAKNEGRAREILTP